jgi:hypothetical protein
MAIAVAGRWVQFVSSSPLRRFFFLGQFMAVGMLAIGISGAICWGIGHRYGKNVIAGDGQSAHLSAARCDYLLEYYPAKSCSLAELAHHYDEDVSYRLGMTAVAAVVFGATLVAGRVLKITDEERRRQRPWHYTLGVAAFGLAAATLLSIGFGKLAAGSTAGTGRWLSDGSVSLAFFALYAAAGWQSRSLALVRRS